jgi:hypothetical protein
VDEQRAGAGARRQISFALRFSRWLLFAGFALTILGGKLWLINTAGSDLPTTDQWDAISESVLRPWLEGRLGAADILRPHNEHRLITTKLYALGLFVANGQWDVYVETVANAIVHTLFAVALLLLAGRWLRGTSLAIFGWLLIALFVAPTSWENTLLGFQVQFYFLLLFSVGHMALALEQDRFTIRWGVGQLCAVLALASMASGFFSSVAVLVTLMIQLSQQRRWTVQQATTAVIAVGGCMGGYLMMTTVPAHEPLHAHGIGRLAWTFLQAEAWPTPVFLPIVFVPGLLFAVRCARRRVIEPGEIILFSLLSWSLLQCAALAYGRGGSTVMSSRYCDLYSFNVALSFLIICTQFNGRTRFWFSAIWLGTVVSSLLIQSRVQWVGPIRGEVENRIVQQANVRSFVQSLDSRQWDKLSWPQVPYPMASALLERLSSPAIRAVLPPSVRRAVFLQANLAAQVPSLPPLLPAPQTPVACSFWSATASPQYWRSATQPASTLPILRFQIAGDLHKANQRLKLVVKSSQGETAVIPDVAPGMRWKWINVVRPAGEWWVEASANDSHGWFALTDPVEVGWGTWLAEKLIKNFRYIIMSGALLLALGLGIASRQSTRNVAES